MNLPFYIAKRYLFSKKSHNAINIISLISVCGIAIATLALVCTLSVFNGFSRLVSNSYSIFDPDLQITAVKGKVFDPNTPQIEKIRNLEHIAIVSESIQENALVKNEDKQSPVLVKGVSPEFLQMIDPNKFIVDGRFVLHEEDVQFCITGITLAIKLGLRSNAIFPIELYSPKRNIKINLANPASAFTKASVYPSALFALNQPKYDDQMMIVSLELARDLFQYETQVSTLDIKLKDNTKTASVKKEIKYILGNDFYVKDQFEQQADAYRMINLEKWVTFLILSFILMIAAFNIVGSLSMLILEKKNDIYILRNLGASNKLIIKIFLLEGWLISLIGSLSGLILGIILCLLQQHLGIIKLGHSPGMFIIDAYPVYVKTTDILFIFITVITISFAIVLYPINALKKNLKS